MKELLHFELFGIEAIACVGQGSGLDIAGLMVPRSRSQRPKNGVVNKEGFWQVMFGGILLNRNRASSGREIREKMLASSQMDKRTRRA